VYIVLLVFLLWLNISLSLSQSQFPFPIALHLYLSVTLALSLALSLSNTLQANKSQPTSNQQATDMSALNKRQKTTHAIHLPEGVFTHILSYCEDPAILYKREHKSEWKRFRVIRYYDLSYCMVQALYVESYCMQSILYGKVIDIQHPHTIENWDDELQEYCVKNYFKCMSCDKNTISATPRKDWYHCTECVGPD
jgi:hypothetical protein